MASLVTAFAIFLDRRARHGAVGAEYATIASKGLKTLTAPFAVVEELAGVCRHGLDRRVIADRTGNGRFQDHAEAALRFDANAAGGANEVDAISGCDDFKAVSYAIDGRDIVNVFLRQRSRSRPMACGAAQLFGPVVGHAAKWF